MIKQFFNNMARVIESDMFPPILFTAIGSFLLGLATGISTLDVTLKKTCDEMSISESLKIPYCRSYFEEQLKELED